MSGPAGTGAGRPAARRRDVLAAGAERAGGERARRRRRTTPLLEDAERATPEAPGADTAGDGAAARAAGTDAPGGAAPRRSSPGGGSTRRTSPRGSASRDGTAARGAGRSRDGARTDDRRPAARRGSGPAPSRPARRGTARAGGGGRADADVAGRADVEGRADAGARADAGGRADVAPSEASPADTPAAGAGPDEPMPTDASASRATPSGEAPQADAARPAGRSGAAPRRAATGGRRRPTGTPRRLHAVPAVPDGAADGRPGELAAHAGELGEAIARDLGDDAPHSEVAARIAEALALLRRRLTGDFEVDEFGFDPELTETLLLPLLRPLYRRWFRVEVRGIENVPGHGGALVVANHSGTIALDALMTQVAVHDEHPQHRHLRMLGADLVFGMPVIGDLARKTGSTLAANPDAERLLAAGEVVGVWPEGFKGIGKPFSERYKLQRFGRGGFVSAALRTRTPIVPCSIVGAEEIYPILGNVATLARLLGTPYAPITPTWPWLGPLGLVPLPSKWLIEFGAPIETADLGDPEVGDAAEDPMLVFDLTDRVRETIQHTLYSLLVQRRSVFF